MQGNKTTRIFSLFILSLIFVSLFSSFVLAATGNGDGLYDKAIKSLETGLSKVTDESALYYVYSIGLSIASLFKGDMEGFIKYLMFGLPAIGVFFLLYIVARFASVITIFRGGSHDWYANMFGWGMAFIGVATPPVFNLLRGLFGGVLGMTLFLGLAIWIVISFFRRMGKDLKKDKGNFYSKKDEDNYKTYSKKWDDDYTKIEKDEEEIGRLQTDIHKREYEDINILGRAVNVTKEVNAKLSSLDASSTPENISEVKNYIENNFVSGMRDSLKRFIEDKGREYQAEATLREKTNEEITNISKFRNDVASSKIKGPNINKIDSLLQEIATKKNELRNLESKAKKFDKVEINKFVTNINNDVDRISTEKEIHVLKRLFEDLDKNLETLLTYERESGRLIVARENIDEFIKTNFKKLKTDKSFLGSFSEVGGG
jgi:hypothetical protein